MNRLVLLRHGRTEGTERHLYYGATDLPLLEDGVRELKDAARRGVYPAPGGPERQAGVISFNVEGFRANEVAAILDREAGICVRAGHHCAAYIHDFLGDEKYDGTIRVSLGAFSTKKDLDVLLKTLRSIDRAQLKGIDAGILRGNC